jgi:NitT/TauT family transport system ATP-binding protein
MVAISRSHAAGVRQGARIDVRNVTHRFALGGEALPVLDDISLTIEPGEFVALLGPSGCGKSTLLRLVAGLDAPAQGVIHADGERVDGPDPSRVVVFQDPTLFPWRTVRDNVALGPQAQRTQRGAGRRDVEERIDAALELVGLSAFAKAFPHQLSGGMAQRAALARALVNDPQLLVLDEPFGKLDSLTRIRMQGELVRLWKDAGFSVLLVTHDVEEALYVANRVIVLSERPARIVSQVRNDAPYPRHRDDPALVRLRRDVLAQLGLDT